MSHRPADRNGGNHFASSANQINNNNSVEAAMYFGEYREPQGCFNACFSGNDDEGRTEIFQPQHYNMNITNATLSQAKDELKETEEFLASEFNKLSFQEQAKALEDVHCAGPEASALGLTSERASSNDIKLSTPDHSDWPRHPLHSNHLNHPDLEPLPKEEQDPRYLNQLFDEFEELVQKENNPFYNMAALQNPEYLKDPVFRLMFLRANFYNPNASVKQLMNFLKLKAEYFGKETVGRDITLKDLTEEDKRMMKSGWYHFQAARDKSGRVVGCMMNKCFGQFDTATVIRVTYYVWINIIIRMPGVQTKGVTACYYDNVLAGQEFALSSLRFLMPLIPASRALPFRYTSMHFCLKNMSSNSGNATRLSKNNRALALLTKGFPHHTRVRMKIHFGSDMELLYQLQAYGIDLKTFPIDMRSGEVKPDEILNKWYYDYHRTTHQVEDTKLPNVTTHSVITDDRAMSNQAIGHFDDLDLDKTLDTHDELLDDLSIVWDNDLLKDGPTTDIAEGDQNNKPVQASGQNMGWLQSLARDTFWFGDADDVTVNHPSRKPPNLALGDSGKSLPAPEPVVTVSPSALATIPGQTVKSTQTSGSLLYIVDPTSDDILLGRGRNVQYHPGNVNFRKWLEEFRDEYEKTPRNKKALIATEMIQILSSNGIRFLKQGPDKQNWVVADSKEAEEKIKQLFRSRRKKQRD